MFDEELKKKIQNAIYNILIDEFPDMALTVDKPTGTGTEASIRFDIGNKKGNYHGFIYLHSFIRVYESSVMKDIIESINNHFHIEQEVKEE